MSYGSSGNDSPSAAYEKAKGHSTVCLPACTVGNLTEIKSRLASISYSQRDGYATSILENVTPFTFVEGILFVTSPFCILACQDAHFMKQLISVFADLEDLEEVASLNMYEPP